MTSNPIDDYLIRLARELRLRGLTDPRIVDEAREHLVDAVADGRLRGLSPEAAQQDAFERFGAPETVAAHAVPERDRIMSLLTAALGTVWQRKWWILAPTVVTALATSVASSYLLPTRYRSEAVLTIMAPLVPAEYVGSTATDRTHARLEHMSQLVLNRRRLERIIDDFDLYQAEQQSTSLSDVIERMRRDIDISLIASEFQQGDVRVSGFNVSFVSSDPRTAMRTTERLASLFVEENLRSREAQVEGTHQFIDAEVDDLRNRIVDYEDRLEKLRAQRAGRPLSQADLLPYDVLKERYKALLVKSEESKVSAMLQRRQVGEQFKVVEAPRMPERPVGPSRVGVNLVGAFAGLGLGLAAIIMRGRSTRA